MFWNYAIQILVLLAGTFITFSLFKKYVLSKYTVKRTHAFSTIIVFCVISIFIPMFTNQLGALTINIVQNVFTVIMCVALLTYMELIRRDKDVKNRPVVGRPKTKKQNTDK